MKELGIYHNDIKLENMMAKKIGSGESAIFKLYLIDVDTMADKVRKSCAYTPFYSPGYAVKYYSIGKKHPFENIFYCNHALDVY